MDQIHPGDFWWGCQVSGAGQPRATLWDWCRDWGNLQNYICGDFIFVFVLLNCVFNNFRSWSAWAMSRSDSERGWETIKDDTGHVLNLRWGGRDRLTDKTIDMPQMFYGWALCSYSHNVDCMYNASGGRILPQQHFFTLFCLIQLFLSYFSFFLHIHTGIEN